MFVYSQALRSQSVMVKPGGGGVLERPAKVGKQREDTVNLKGLACEAVSIGFAVMRLEGAPQDPALNDPAVVKGRRVRIVEGLATLESSSNVCESSRECGA